MKATIYNTVLTSYQNESLSTEQLAKSLCVEAQTIRAGLCRKGHYLGMRPRVKLPNGRLLWDPAQLEMMLAGGGIK